ncbi:putative GTP-binding protein EngB [Candidatus Gullanella endobia]|uniref:Probable GTP-binding protein EngB n=1 Tax=Candidatus Gullanella endobia TaxID=1070130 RepID=A0A143WQ63_9ENTR|nr:ribosome biogenesis GTP-binding protein YihA/YsxC [Candidatus Gullanella endobia]CUX95868.1 putative GTP-binding protein EngB [Candidatus Gullanella endobia]
MKKFYNYQLTHFVSSKTDIHSFPSDSGIEIAFSGRSNAGKSSAINALTNKKNLARTSKIPGCTQLINIFEVKSGIRLIDLPGYGYAKVPQKLKRNWHYVLVKYLKMRKNLKGLVILMDIRYPMKDLDQKIVQLAIDINIPVLILLTKSDKLSSFACKTQLNQVRKIVLSFIGDIQVEIFSSLKKIGINKLKQKLNDWFTHIQYHSRKL